MKFAYLKNGTIPKDGFNRVGIASELTGTCTGGQRTVLAPNTLNGDCYMAINGNLVKKDQSAIDTIITQHDKDSAYSSQVVNIEKKKDEENLKNFQYLGNDFKSDKESIQATQNECLSADVDSKILTLRGTAYEGCWAAIGAFVPFTCGQFIDLATEYFKRGSDNFTTRSAHLMAIDAIYQDGNSTAQDILAYDYSQGWH